MAKSISSILAAYGINQFNEVRCHPCVLRWEADERRYAYQIGAIWGMTYSKPLLNLATNWGGQGSPVTMRALGMIGDCREYGEWPCKRPLA